MPTLDIPTKGVFIPINRCLELFGYISKLYNNFAFFTHCNHQF